MNATPRRSSRLLPLLILVGPAFSASTLSAGVGVWTSNGPYGGPFSLAIDPTAPSTLYATGSGGVFKSTNGGESWTPIDTGLTTVNVGGLVIDPVAPATLYAGTDRGLFKSTNGGGSWGAVNTGLDGYFTVWAIDPSNSSTLYGSADGAGVLKSTDGGGSWTAINAGLTNPNVTAFAIDPSTPTTLYAGTSYSGRVYKSTNGGASWAFTFDYPNSGVYALAIDPTAPSILYGGLGSEDGGGGVIKSTDGGDSWTESLLDGPDVFSLVIDHLAPATVYAGTDTGLLKSTNGGLTWGAVALNQPGYISVTVAISPSAPARLYAATLGGLFVSSDGGGSWTAIDDGLTNPIAVNALAIDPLTPTVLYAGTFGAGLFKSTDGGASWTANNISLNDGFVSALAVDPSHPATLYAGTAPAPGLLGIVFKSNDGGASWAESGLYGPEVSSLVIDHQAPDTLYAGTWTGVFKSTNGGASWIAVNDGLTDDYHSVYSLAIDPQESTTLYALTNGGVFKSTNGGANWTESFVGRFVSALAIDPSTPGTLYAGSGGVFKSIDGGESWVASSVGLTGVVEALAIDPKAPSTLYAAGSGGVFRSTDSGATWGAFNVGLPNPGDVNTLALDPTGTTLYAALRVGGLWRLTGPAMGSITAILPTCAHAPGANRAFYTTDVSVANTGTIAASVTLKFLGHDQDGSSGPERSFNLDPGTSTTFSDVLGSVFGQTNNFGAIRITSNSSALGIVSVTSTPGFGGTFDQEIPAIPFADLIPAGSSRSILYIREGDGFRTNLILASGSSVSTDVDVALVSAAGATLATKTYSVPPNGMIQVNRVARDMGVSTAITGARLVLSSSTSGALFTGLASVIDETTNDPTAVLAQSASVSGSAPYAWLLPASAHSSGLDGAFYTTNLAVANVGVAPVSFTMKFLGHDQDGTGGPEQTFNLEPGKSVIYFDVLEQVFGQASGFGAIRVTSDAPSLDIVSVTSTPGFGGTLSQTIPAIRSSDLIPAGSSRSILHILEGDGFRTNLILASNASALTTVDATLVSPAGATLATKSYSVPPNGMTQIDRVVRDMGVSGLVNGARLVLSSSTSGTAFTAFASVIDEVTNDPTAVEAR